LFNTRHYNTWLRDAVQAFHRRLIKKIINLSIEQIIIIELLFKYIKYKYKFAKVSKYICHAMRCSLVMNIIESTVGVTSIVTALHKKYGDFG
jgi:hypothetical protein